MYAAGKTSPQKEPCENLLRAILKKSSREKFCTNSEVLQEILHRYLSIGYRDIAFKIIESIYSLGIPIFPVDQNDLRRAKTLLQTYDNLSVRDAVHLGVMQGNGIVEIATYDQDFSLVEWVRVIKP